MDATDSPSHGAETTNPLRLAVIDDDDLSREVLTVIAVDAGFEVESFASGENALTALGRAAGPVAVLTDMQMPGISGTALALQLRAECPALTMLLAMSGSAVSPEKLSGYDGFLLKPLSAEALKAAFGGARVQAAADVGENASVLDEAVFANFARSMPDGKVFGLYTLCLNDSAKRVAAMRKALEARDDDAYRRAAHAIKGGCGMVGAVELAQLAAGMEAAGLPTEHDAAPLDHFLAASARLERMLDSKATGSRDEATAVRALATA